MAVVRIAPTKLTDLEVAQLVYRAGWRGDDLVTAIRIVLGESGGNPRARNVNKNGTVDRGLWQLNDRANPTVSPTDAFDPERSTAYAFSVYRKQRGFQPGRSAWWGKTKFHTLTPAGKPADDLVRRAAAAAAQVDQQPAAGFKLGGMAWMLLLALGAFAMSAQRE